ncbi:MAG TPA: 2-phospho-L-lactate guanylyltransferase [Acidimicrobiales bacterium]|nr:2-phospho-L-lactate guanylyltransferase [Acidimicrobiales bacterium]
MGRPAGRTDSGGGGRPPPPSPAGADLGSHVVLVPVKAFHHAKVRLTPALAPAARAALARAMAERVVAAAAPLSTAVVCDDPAVATWAGELGALVIWEPGKGLNRAVEAGVGLLAAAGVTRVTVAHADLPLATSLARVTTVDPALASAESPPAGERVVLVPDWRLDGTNVASLPTPTAFRFAYGPGSFRRHWVAATRLGLAVEVVRETGLARDVDVPADLAALGEDTRCALGAGDVEP